MTRYVLPVLYPDECIYSLVARYSARLGYPVRQTVMRQLFGSPFVHATLDFPTRLALFASVCPSGETYTADDIIDVHTQFRLFQPFLCEEQVQQLRTAMIVENSSIIPSQVLSIRRGSVTVPETFRFCPKCAKNDRQVQGECYWHRLHQIPGMEVCPVHEVWLEESTAPARALGGWHQFVTAEEATNDAVPRPLSVYEPGRETMLQLANDAAWLLNQTSLHSDPVALWRRYRYLLREQGLCSYRGKVATKELLARFYRMCPPVVLARIEGHAGRLTSGRGILSLVRKPRTGLPPLYHLLMMQCLGKTAEEFFGMPAEPADFGSGPWPCLNKLAPHYRQSIVTKVSIHIQKDGGRPVATFSCRCGFRYCRVGPDWGPLAQFSYTRVEEYGPLWDRKFTRLWSSPEHALSFISQIVGIAEKNLPAHAARLRLPVWRRENGRAAIPGRKRTWRGRLERPHMATIRAMRDAWVVLCSKRMRSAIESREERRLYHWLYRHDHEWLTAQPTHAGGANHGSANRRAVDWDARDAFLADTIRTAAMTLRTHGTMSMNQLIRSSGFRHLIHPNLKRLPLTRRALVSCVLSRSTPAVSEWSFQESDSAAGLK